MGTKKIQIGNHDFLKVSVIPDVFLVHSRLEEDHKEDGKDKEFNKYSVGKWYSGKVFYNVRDMATWGCFVFQGVTELSMAMEDFHGSESNLPHLYFYTMSGGDRKNTNFKFQKSLISVEMSDIWFPASWFGPSCC